MDSNTEVRRYTDEDGREESERVVGAVKWTLHRHLDYK